MTIGQSIRKAREAKGYSQAKLAMKSGVNVQTISQWELDKAFGTVIYLIPVADALGISIDELVGRTEYNNPCAHCRFYPPSSCDGKPCLVCPAQGKE